MSSLKSFICGLIDESVSFEILPDNARVPSSSKLSISTDGDSSDEKDSAPHRPLHKSRPSKGESRWDSMLRSTKEQQLITPKRCTSPIRIPLRSLATEIRFSALLDNGSYHPSKRLSEKLAIDLIDEAVSVCSGSPLLSS
jgi:hypothetical protein